MATVITLPNIVGLDTELCVPEGNQRLWNYFSVEGYSVKHSKIFEPHLFMPTNRANLPYQKMVDRYQFLTSDGVKPQCAPLCQEGWYFDCETETCKEYSSYRLIFEQLTFYTKSMNLDGQIVELSLTDNYPNIPNSILVDNIGTIGYFYRIPLIGTASNKYFSMTGTAVKGTYENDYLGEAKEAGNEYIVADPWGTYWWNSFTQYSEVLEFTISLNGSVEGIK